MKKTSNALPRTRGEIIFDAVNLALVWLVLLCCAYPLYYTVIASFSDPTAVMTGRIYLWPKGVTLDNYRNVMRYRPLWIGYRNTLFYTTFGTAYNLFLLLPAAYAMSKRHLKGRNLIMALCVFTMYFGGGMVPSYLNIKSLGLLNSRLVLIIPGAFSVYYMIVTRTFFASNFSESLAESARMDGASELRIFVQIALPLSTAIIAVMALYFAVGHWNSWFGALLYLSDPKKQPLQMALRQVLLLNVGMGVDHDAMDMEEMLDTVRRMRLAETMKYAVIFFANAPVLAMYPFLQKHFTKGVMIGSIKG